MSEPKEAREAIVIPYELGRLESSEVVITEKQLRAGMDDTELLQLLEETVAAQWQRLRPSVNEKNTQKWLRWARGIVSDLAQEPGNE